MNLQENIKKILREEVRRKLIHEQTTNKPKNATYVVPNNYSLSSDSFTGDDLVIPKGTTFTSHQSGYFNNGKVESSKFWVSVDKIVDADTYTSATLDVRNTKLTYSTIFYCQNTIYGGKQGKFWDVSKKSWFTDEKKTLSNILLKNVCFKANRDYWAIQNQDKWDEQKQQKAEDELAQKTSPYVDANGKKVLYYKSTEFKKTNDFLISQGLNVRGTMGNNMPKPNSPNQHYNYAALFSIKEITDYAINKIGWSNNQCLQIGLSELGNVKMKSKMISKYNVSLSENIQNEQSPLYSEITRKAKPPYVNFILSDFYFKFGNLIKDVEINPNRIDTYYFPDGVYNFMSTFFGDSLNVSQIMRGYSSLPACAGGGLTSQDWRGVLTTLQFASAFIPVAGPFIAAGIGIADAAIAYNQGNKEEAAIGFILSAVPLAAEIPGLKNVGQAVMKQIGGKILNKLPLTAYESEVVSYIGQNKAAVEEVTTKWFADNSKNEVVKHIADTAKDKGEEWLEDKIKEKAGVQIPVSKSGVKRLAQNQIKTSTSNTIKKVMA